MPKLSLPAGTLIQKLLNSKGQLPLSLSSRVQLYVDISAFLGDLVHEEASGNATGNGSISLTLSRDLFVLHIGASDTIVPITGVTYRGPTDSTYRSALPGQSFAQLLRKGSVVNAYAGAGATVNHDTYVSVIGIVPQ